jgi:indolepyruvate decarboxylase
VYQSENITVATHLTNRLAEIGIRHLFGVPGDYNLVFLDSVIAHPDVTWVGNANELNAAYAADAYGRCRGAAALATTFGVGELSAINGLAGSYAEYVPVLQIVGAPSTRSQKAREVLHHTLGDGHFGQFEKMHEAVTVARAFVTPENAVAEIDRVIGEMLLHRRPGYLVLPTDVVNAPVSNVPPFKHLSACCDKESLAKFREHAARLVSDSPKVAVLADFLADRFNARSPLFDLINEGNLPHAAMLLGKGLLDETVPNFTGTYVGASGSQTAKACIEDADPLISVGVLLTDVITAGFSHKLNRDRTIDLQPFHANIAGVQYRDVPMHEALGVLTELVVKRPHLAESAPLVRAAIEAPVATANESIITQSAFWNRMERFLRPSDLVVAEQGTSFFGIGARQLPADAKFIGQPLWGSIGYAIPAAYGAGTACPDRRVVLFVGDGSAHLSAQELGSMLRDRMKPVIFVLNNDGYTVERAIHGATQRYNDIASWNWQLLAQALGAGSPSESLRAGTLAELERALVEAEASDCLTLVEVMLPKQDVPELLAAITRGVATINGSKRAMSLDGEMLSDRAKGC